MVLTHT